ncbi:DNA cytosine methyltransferase [Amycolatopsis dendrobii]|uniref:DNA cytosine methyltransferase n=1 Tax=Amycolatopsis dendrobii TaxID=2760662 RepID=A0A7W3VVF7_9PSEU|nr:DNA cytosine methyltransferase [Amycolatopsis dendrobii]MBB1153969.1 DNA cytosine methyltransferase [Amycolatopsis dendrobii]
MKPLVIDGFACAGGAGRGFADAGFEVVGVEQSWSPNYPYLCHEGDALAIVPELVRHYRLAAPSRPIHVHTSPPCQGQIAITQGNRGRDGWTDQHVNLLPQTRAMVAELRDRYGVTTSIENGPSRHIRSDLRLCGLQFRLPTFRHRDFELGGFTVAPPRPHAGLHRGHRTIGWRHGCLATPEPRDCPKCGVWHRGTVYGVYGSGGGKPTVQEAQLALGLYHTDDIEELNEAIPPAYTRHIGLALQALYRAGAARAAA